MLEEYTEIFNAMTQNIEAAVGSIPADPAEKAGVYDAVREVVGEALLNAAKAAIAKTPELQHPLLAERLLDNLSNINEHIIIHGNVIKVFNENYAGTKEDLLAGQQAGGSDLTHTQRAANVWKYGIYLQQFGESFLAEKLGLPTYEQVITARLAEWGEKAPYWFFLENGNVGMDRAYPTFAGTGFIAETRKRATGILIRARQIFGEKFLADLEQMAEATINLELAPRTRVTLFRYRVGETRVSLQRTSAGNFFYRIGNNTYSVDQFKKIVWRLL